MATQGRERSQVVFGRGGVGRVGPPADRGLHPHDAKGGKQRGAAKQEIVFSPFPAQDEAVNEPLRAQVLKLGGARLATDAPRDFGNPSRHAYKALSVKGRESCGDILDNPLDDTPRRLRDPHRVGVDGRFGRNLVINREQGDSGSGAPY